jgi:hypothetical protein
MALISGQKNIITGTITMTAIRAGQIYAKIPAKKSNASSLWILGAHDRDKTDNKQIATMTLSTFGARRRESTVLALTSLFARTVDLVYRYVVIARSNDTSNHSVAITAKQLLPRISPAVAGVNVAGRLVDKEEPNMAVTIFPSSSKDGRIMSKLHNVVKLQNLKLDITHGTPPSVKVVLGVPTEVSLWRFRAASTAPMTTIAAMIRRPATVAPKICGWVNNLTDIIPEIVAMRAGIRGVSPRRRALRQPPLTTIAAVPATEGCGRVNNLAITNLYSARRLSR